MKNSLILNRIPAFSILLVAAGLLLLAPQAAGQATQKVEGSWLLESRFGILGAFGPSESQAEIQGGTDSISYDHLQHWIPGFRTALPVSLGGLYLRNGFSCGGQVRYLRQELGWIQSLERMELPLGKADILEIHAQGGIRLLDTEKPAGSQLYFNLFLGCTHAFRFDLDNKSQELFGVRRIMPAWQFNWGVSFDGIIPVGKSGLCGILGARLTFPGILGSIGRIELEAGSGFEAVRRDIRRYSLALEAGVGWRFNHTGRSR